MKNKLLHTLTKIIFFSSVLLLMTGCKKQVAVHNNLFGQKNGIERLEVLSATGDKNNPNYIDIRNYWDSKSLKNDFDNKLFDSETAWTLLDEIMALPDGNYEDGPLAYKIFITYYDENHKEHSIIKYGYGKFPDNWPTIISHINEITEGTAHLTDSTELTVIDGEFLKKNFNVSEDKLPEGVTLDDVLEKYPITYEELFVRNFSFNYNIDDYMYDYYDLASFKPTLDMPAERSDMDALREYADEHLDSYYERDLSVVGKYNGIEFEIALYDHFDEWKNTSGVTEVVIREDNTFDLVRVLNAGCEGMTVRDIWEVFIDPSHRFVIITEYADSETLKEFFDK